MLLDCHIIMSSYPDLQIAIIEAIAWSTLIHMLPWPYHDIQLDNHNLFLVFPRYDIFSNEDAISCGLSICGRTFLVGICISNHLSMFVIFIQQTLPKRSFDILENELLYSND